MTDAAEPTATPADDAGAVSDDTIAPLPDDAAERAALLETLVPEVVTADGSNAEQPTLFSAVPEAAEDDSADAATVPAVEDSEVTAPDEGEDAATDEPVLGDDESGDELTPEPGVDPAVSAIAQDLAAEPVHAAPEGDAAVAATAAGIEAAQIAAPATGSAPWWPFIGYAALWLVLAGAAGYALVTRVPDGTPVFDSEVYTLTVLGGIALTIAGPILILAVWLAEWFRRGDEMRRGLFLSALLKGSVVTLFGVVVWWATLIIVDTIRLGRPL